MGGGECGRLLFEVDLGKEGLERQQRFWGLEEWKPQPLLTKLRFETSRLGRVSISFACPSLNLYQEGKNSKS